MDSSDATQPVILHPKVQLWQWVVLGFMVGLTYLVVHFDEYDTWAIPASLLLAWLYLYLRLSTVLFSLKSYWVVFRYRRRLGK